MADFDSVKSEALLRLPGVPSLLVEVWVKEIFREIWDRTNWSWSRKQEVAEFPAVYNTGTVSVTNGSATVTGSGTTFASSMVGRQFRTSQIHPIYTVSAVGGATSLTLGRAWNAPTASSQTYEIWKAYHTVPSDFHDWISVYDPQYSRRLHLHYPIEKLNRVDPQRTYAETSWAVADLDYDESQSPPRPRYEFWPHNKTAKTYPYLYRKTFPEPAPGSSFPGRVSRHIVVRGVLREAANWPGTEERPNRFASSSRAKTFADLFEKDLQKLERRDGEIFNEQVFYQEEMMTDSPYFDSEWLQSHHVPW